MEGLPLYSLSEELRSEAKQQIVTQYFDFLESFGDKLPREGGSAIYGAPVFALSAALQFHLISISDAEMKTIKFLLAIIQKYRDSSEIKVKDKYRRLLSETLGIISNMKHLYTSNDMEEVILALQNLFISGPALSDGKSFQCKPNLSSFMAGLGYVELEDREDSAVSSAMWELYHMLLKECHWALVHLAITAFGYFAGRTTCSELWRFVPQDAALSFDLETGKEAVEERFMSDLKEFLEKETACPKIKPCADTINMLAIDGQMLKETLKKIRDVDPKLMVCEPMEVDNEKQTNRKKNFLTELPKEWNY